MMLCKIVNRILARLEMNPDKPIPPALPNPFIWIWQRLFGERSIDKRVLSTRKRYKKDLLKVKRKVKSGRPIRVLFIVTYSEKWKAQSLYDLLVSDKRFEPLIGVSYQKRDNLTIYQIKESMDSVEEALRRRGCKCVRLFEPFRDRYVKPSKFSPDIVFYPEVWYTPIQHSPARVSRFALTCYIPYFVPNYVELEHDCMQEMHRFYWRHFVLNKELESLYTECTSNRLMAGEFIGVGHPMLDAVSCGLDPSPIGGKPIVIYAPHYSFDHPCHSKGIMISTFAITGNPILDYAKKHSEFDWVFKPHPHLYQELIKSGFMDQEETDKYYESWRRIGTVCDSGEYMPVFRRSYAMITDCGSFLSEYGATGKPIIHLVSARNKIVPPKKLADVYDKYYKVHNLNEMYRQFKLVLEERKDPMMEDRHKALALAALCQTNAAENIVEYFVSIFEMA